MFTREVVVWYVPHVGVHSKNGLLVRPIYVSNKQNYIQGMLHATIVRCKLFISNVELEVFLYKIA